MSKNRRARFVPLRTLLRHRFPDRGEPEELIAQGAVTADGAPIVNPNARVRADASIRLHQEGPLRGTIKLAHALQAFSLDVADLIALDVGAAAGGFTRALLDTGVRRVYAVDVGFGQLRGALRQDRRVVNLERTNIAQLDRQVIEEEVDLVTMDLSYLSYLPVADALSHIPGRLLASDARLLVLVKPTYELRTGSLAARPEDVASAVGSVRGVLSLHGWRTLGSVLSPIRGARGAAEAFVLARREPDRGSGT
jgi:23S rRNA (cytidine1920-2'-O)/16S rRNA (cytidine1409-2'-O)-methyltransferase